MLGGAYASKWLRVAAVALVFAGCASTRQTVEGWFGRKPAAGETAAGGASSPRVYYASVEGLKVYAEPTGSSKVVGALALHERVTRTRVERGYAYVQSAKSDLKGWVDNGALTWRVPAGAAPAAGEHEEPAPSQERGQTAAPAGPEGEEPPAAPAAAAPPPAPEPAAAEAVTSTTLPPSPRPKKTPGGVGPSVLDAY